MRLALLASVLLVAACAPEPSDVTPDMGDETTAAESAFTDAAPPGVEQLVITTTDGAVDLGLTDRVVYMRLSDTQRAEIEGDLTAKTDAERGGIGSVIAETVTDAVGGLLERSVQIPVEDVRMVHDGEGRLDIQSTGGGAEASFGDNGGAPMFDPADAERFVAAFERVQAGR